MTMPSPSPPHTGPPSGPPPAGCLQKLAIPGIILTAISATLAGISAYFAYRGGSPAFVITNNHAVGIIDPEKFDYEVEWENIGTRAADEFTIVSIAVNLSTGQNREILSAAVSNAVPTRVKEHARAPVANKDMEDFVVLCLSFKDPALFGIMGTTRQHFYYKGQLFEPTVQASSWFYEVSSDEKKRLDKLNLCGP